MPSEQKRGLSPEKFVARVEDSGSVVQHWPFGHMSEPQHFTTDYPTGIYEHHAIQNGQFIAKGQIFLPGSDIVMLLKDEKNRTTFKRLHLQMEDKQEEEAWEQMAGVNVALQVEVGPPSPYTGERDGQLTRVLGIEQPIYTSRPGGGFRNTKASREKGFIQGAIVDSRYNQLYLDVGKREQPALISMRATERVISTENGFSRHVFSHDWEPIPGEEIRSHVSRGIGENYFTQSGLLYVLNQTEQK